MKSTVIKQTVERDLCIGCGICAAICPKGLLEMEWNCYGEYNPIEIIECVNECGLCLKVCPFGETNHNEDAIGKTLYGSVSGVMHRPETGYFLTTYVGYADEEHRMHGASGGIATWLFERLLDEKIVDRIICVTPDDNLKKLFSFKILNTSEEVRAGAGSAYYPVELSKVIKYILETPGRYGIIGLPCFIKAIRLAQIQNKKLNERITVTIGLVCGQLKNRYFTDYIATLAGVKERMMAVRYRGKSPDVPVNNYYYSFTDSQGKERKIFWNDGISEAWVNRWFTPKACNYCDDVFAECADAVCMDAWLPDYLQDSRGTSLILTRSSVIAQIIDDSIRSHKVFLSNIPIEKLVQSQEGVIAIKRQQLSYRLYNDLQSGYKAPQKRVIPVRLKNPFLQREIVLREHMRLLSKDLWNSRGHDYNYFTERMQRDLKQLEMYNVLLKGLILPISAIRCLIRRNHE